MMFSHTLERAIPIRIAIFLLVLYKKKKKGEKVPLVLTVHQPFHLAASIYFSY